MALLMNANADSYCLQWKFQHSILMIDFTSPVVMALSFQILANPELEINLYGKPYITLWEGGESSSHL